MNSMELDWEPDQMEYEYTNPSESTTDHSNYSQFNRNPLIIDSSAFRIPESYLEHNYKKNSFLTNTVCSLLDKFSLSEDSQAAKGVTTATAANEAKENAVVLRKGVDSTDDRAKCSSSSELTVNSLSLSPSSASSPVITEVNDLSESRVGASSPTPLTLSNSTPSLANAGSNDNIPHYTFVYNAAPKPVPTDPLIEQHGTIYYLFGIFKLVCASVFFIGVLYIITQFFNYVQHDMKALIASYESDLLGDQMYCQHQYELNRCSPQTRLPAIVDLCREWERCMLKPLAVSRTKILAEVAAEMWNGFTKTLTVKSMVLNLFVGGMILVFLSNITPKILSRKSSLPALSAQPLLPATPDSNALSRPLS